ncbi:hypothetical protein CDEN61S_03248 [Castellaniella denitrificans]
MAAPLALAHLQAGRLTVYTVGFFIFWIMGALSSALTLRIAPRGVSWTNSAIVE